LSTFDFAKLPVLADWGRDRLAAAAEIIVLDPPYSTHDQDENDTRAMAALCQSLLRLREASHQRSRDASRTNCHFYG
jgi:hypothetical protein